MILEENSHQKVRRLAESSFQCYFLICDGRLCVHDFITHNSSKFSNRTFLPYFCHSFYCLEIVVILPLFVDLIIDENYNGHEKLKKRFLIHSSYFGGIAHPSSAQDAFHSGESSSVQIYHARDIFIIFF